MTFSPPSMSSQCNEDFQSSVYFLFEFCIHSLPRLAWHYVWWVWAAWKPTIVRRDDQSLITLSLFMASEYHSRSQWEEYHRWQEDRRRKGAKQCETSKQNIRVAISLLAHCCTIFLWYLALEMTEMTEIQISIKNHQVYSLRHNSFLPSPKVHSLVCLQVGQMLLFVKCCEGKPWCTLFQMHIDAILEKIN